jgi:phosphatidylglycerol:prolipoprotein diacylglycerol transferase
MPIYIHRLRPEIFSLTDTLAVRWYGLAYLAGFLIAYLLLKRLARQGLLDMPPARVQDFLTTLAIFGVMLGGRLGFFLFYQPRTLLDDPLQLIRVWEGGMASHGGILGLALVMLWWARKYKVSFWNLSDNLCAVGPAGLALGRLANFINGELWGRPTSGSWGVVFPLERWELNPGGPLADHRYDLPFLQSLVEQGHLVPRHPSQLYQALGEGLLLFLMLWGLRQTTWSKEQPGRLSFVFLGGYGLFRFLAEFFREPDADTSLLFGWMTRGQLLTALMLLSSVILLFWFKSTTARKESNHA